MKIDCTTCEMYRSHHCDDCLVTALLHPPAAEVEIADGLGEPLGTLAGAGLIPVLKFRPRAVPDPDQAKHPPDHADTG
jgi:hypothetical protein